MKTLLVAFTLAVALPGESAAQPPDGRIARDHCYTYGVYDPANDDWVYKSQCAVAVFDAGVSPRWYGILSAFDPALSPEGKRVAVVGLPIMEVIARSNITVVNLEEGSRSVVFDRGAAPAWSADGRIAFESDRSGSLELYVMNGDGTGVRQVTTGVGFRGRPSWSPDGRIAFECENEPGNWDICSIHSDGTGFARLTTSPERHESAPAFSPEGTRIAFVDRVSYELSILNADGNVSHLGVWGYTPAWSPDGSRIAYSIPWSGACEADGPACGGYFSLYSVNIDGTNNTSLGSGGNPSWALSPGGFPPSAYFTVACTLLICTFDASRSSDDGGMIVSYAWRFGDGTTATGSAPAHTYATSGSYSVELIVVDDSGARGTMTHSVDVTASPPVASFTAQCSGQTCIFDASQSSDPDGAIVLYLWSFGDGTSSLASVVSHTYAPGTYSVTVTVVDNAGARDTESTEIVIVDNRPTASFEFSCNGLTCDFDGSRSFDSDGLIVRHVWNFGDAADAVGPKVTHTYAASGTYTVVLTVTDNAGGVDTFAATVTVVQPIVHIGDLDGSTDSLKRSWNAVVNVTLHDAAHRPVPNAAVTGIWSNGSSSSCTTSDSGVCIIVLSGIRNSMRSTTFSVRTVIAGQAFYDAARNHDVDGETNGSSITVIKP
jgi:PKD repeat protein